MLGESPICSLLFSSRKMTQALQKRTPLPGGEFLVDLRPRISVPGETDDWTEDFCKDSFEELSRLPSQQYFPLLSYSICFIDLTPEEFFGWVMKRGFDVPKFWTVTDATQRDFRHSNSYIASDANSGGRPEEYDWEKIKSFALQFINEYGAPSKSNKRIPNKQALIDAICDEWAKKSIELHASTVRNHLNRWLKELRER